VEPLRLTFKGTVIGPTFNFNKDDLVFGTVPYGFLSTTSVTLQNTSEIPLQYKLRIPQDGKFMQREFGIEPAQGTIYPQDKGEIKIDFVSQTCKSYDDYTLVIDVDGVGECLKKIPIRATCQVPDISVDILELDFGDCFLRHPYKEMIPVTNSSDMYAKFEVQMQDDTAKSIAIVEPAQQGACISPRSTFELPVSITAQRLGPINLPVYITIPGLSTPPILVTIKLNAVGPKVSVDHTSLNYHEIAVLRKFEKTVWLQNESLIMAEYVLSYPACVCVCVCVCVLSLSFYVNICAHMNFLPYSHSDTRPSSTSATLRGQWSTSEARSLPCRECQSK
jgi:hydrocephalus-inducing protein